jgi:hypothetical protein
MCSKNTLFITHIDSPGKLLVVKNRLQQADLGICMSRMMVEELVRRGVDRKKLCFISPASDGLLTPRRIVIGITSIVRADKAKREDVLVQVSKMMRLDDFHFEIIGYGWEKVIPHLIAVGATVRYFPGTERPIEDYKLNLERVPNFDYYLYLGLDEGSMGILDALSAGIPTIVTPQGFHLDINDGITYSFIEASELSDILKRFVIDRQKRIDSVSTLTWNEYARQHAIVWRAIVRGEQAGIDDLLHKGVIHNYPLPYPLGKGPRVEWIRFWRNRRSFSRDAQMFVELYSGLKLSETHLWKFLFKGNKKKFL